MHGGLLVLWRLKDMLGGPSNLVMGAHCIKELRLLKNHFTKPSSSTLTALDGSPLTTDTAKLARWAEHLSSVVNCGVEVSENPLKTCQSSHHLFTLVNHLTLMTCVLHSPRRRSVLPTLN